MEQSDACGKMLGKWEIGQGETSDPTVLGQECAHQSHSVEEAYGKGLLALCLACAQPPRVWGGIFSQLQSAVLTQENWAMLCCGHQILSPRMAFAPTWVRKCIFIKR